MFTSFALESDATCSYDSLTIYDGASVNETSVGKFCGYVEPQYMYTTGNEATLIFQSDSSQTRDGFQILFTAIGAATTAVIPTQQPGRRLEQIWSISHGISIYGFIVICSWWRHQMKNFSASLALYAVNSPVTGEFPAQRPVTRSFDVFFDLRLNKRLSRQSWGWWFETPWRPLWRHCNAVCSHVFTLIL